MKISDEQLSAFLDAELSVPEMELIRQQISDDENLANRLAELAMVDEQVASHYARIDKRPMPESVTRLLTTNGQNSVTASAPVAANIVVFPRWKKVHAALQQHAAMAASIALVIGFCAAQLLPTNESGEADKWNAVAQVLDTSTSGNEHILGDGNRIKPRLSFINRDGNYCRQFQLTNDHRTAENIACRIDNQWQLTLAVYTQSTVQNSDYQTASGGSVLDDALDEMMQSEAFDAAAEAQAISNKWRRNK